MPSCDKWELPGSALVQFQELSRLPVRGFEATGCTDQPWELSQPLARQGSLWIVMAILVPDGACADGACVISQALIASLNFDLSPCS